MGATGEPSKFPKVVKVKSKGARPRALVRPCIARVHAASGAAVEDGRRRGRRSYDWTPRRRDPRAATASAEKDTHAAPGEQGKRPTCPIIPSASSMVVRSHLKKANAKDLASAWREACGEGSGRTRRSESTPARCRRSESERRARQPVGPRRGLPHALPRSLPLRSTL